MLRVVIVDDEPPARKRLRRLLAPLVEAGRLSIIAEAGDGFEALAVLDQQPADLLFLDIQMPEMDGFDVVERLDPATRPMVVFTTAYDEYAIRAFEANAVDYLLKPISKERLHEAVSRVARGQPEETQRQNEARLARLLDWMEARAETERQPAPSPPPEYLQQLSIPYRDRILIVPVERLVSVEINEGITRLYILEESAAKPRLRQHIVSYTLDQLETYLDPALFMRVHRSAIVQFDQIRELIPWFSGRFKLVLTGDHEVIASRERSKMLKDRLML